METETIEQKVKAVEKKVASAKRRISKRVTAKKPEGSPNAGNVEPPEQEKPKKKREPKKPQSPSEFWQSYISQGEMTTSGAKLTAFLMSRPGGCSMKELIARASEIALMKQSSWGTSKGHIKSHINYLKSRGCKVEELSEDVFRISI